MVVSAYCLLSILKHHRIRVSCVVLQQLMCSWKENYASRDLSCFG
jgi:hypothetical protein